MLEVYVLVAKKISLLKQFASSFLLVLTVITFAMSFVIPFVIIPAVLLMGCCYLVFSQLRIEYEYSYFDGDVRFAKIMNKSRRKTLRGFSMDEVVMIAPAKDPSVFRYEEDGKVKRIDYTSRYFHRDIYDMVVTVPGEGTRLIRFEPDDSYLDAVCVKYPQKVVRGPRKENKA